MHAQTHTHTHTHKQTNTKQKEQQERKTKTIIKDFAKKQEARKTPTILGSLMTANQLWAGEMALTPVFVVVYWWWLPVGELQRAVMRWGLFAVWPLWYCLNLLQVKEWWIHDARSRRIASYHMDRYNTCAAPDDPEDGHHPDLFWIQHDQHEIGHIYSLIT